MKDRSRLLSVTIGTVTLAVEVLILANAALGNWTTLPAALAHLATVAGLAAWAWISKSCRQDLRFPMLLTMATCFMGPVGTAGTLLTMVLTEYYSRSASTFEEWYASLFPETRVRKESELWERIVMSQDEVDQTSVAPFSDILIFGTLSQKQELISLISKHFQPVFAPILRLALNDANTSIRVQAASAITVIEDDFLKRSVKLSAAVQQGSSSDPSLLWKLAQLMDEYASAGILDHEREQESRQKALEAYRKYLQLRPDDIAARIAIGRLLLRDGNYGEAADWLAQSIGASDVPLELLLLYMQCLYRLGRFGELRQLAARHRHVAESGETDIEVVETFKLWAEGA